MGALSAHDFVGRICQEYRQKDSRIKYQKLAKNEGISGNTNECYKMATGNYIALFDHDDLLHPCVLSAYMQAICEKYTTSVKAYLLIPLVGSLFADFINSLVITFFINLI